MTLQGNSLRGFDLNLLVVLTSVLHETKPHTLICTAAYEPTCSQSCTRPGTRHLWGSASRVFREQDGSDLGEAVLLKLGPTLHSVQNVFIAKRHSHTFVQSRLV